MSRLTLAGLACLAALAGGCAGLPTITIERPLTSVTATSTEVATADEHANWSEFGETPAGVVVVSDATDASHETAYENWSDFGESPAGVMTSSAMMLEPADDEHANWSEFGESPPDSQR